MKMNCKQFLYFAKKQKTAFGEIYIDNFAKSNEKVNIGRKRLICWEFYIIKDVRKLFNSLTVEKEATVPLETVSFFSPFCV